MISERHEKFILDEYRASGLEAVRRSDGELVTLGLARRLNLLNTRATGAQQVNDAYQEAENGSA